MDAIPQCPQMHYREDIVEIQLAMGNSEKHPHSFTRTIVTQSYWLECYSPTDTCSSKSSIFGSMTSGSTWREVANTLIGLFTLGPTIEKMRNQVATEKLLQLLPSKLSPL